MGSPGSTLGSPVCWRWREDGAGPQAFFDVGGEVGARGVLGTFTQEDFLWAVAVVGAHAGQAGMRGSRRGRGRGSSCQGLPPHAEL